MHTLLVQLIDNVYFIYAALATAENITVTSDGSMVRFFVGPEVLVPKDNILIADEQCFEIGLLCTVVNTPVFHGDTFHYSAYVETDFGIRTSTQRNTLKVRILIHIVTCNNPCMKNSFHSFFARHPSMFII